MKGRAFEPSHPVSITIRPIPHVHSNADKHAKHDKQQRREEVTMFFLESFEVPTQNLYTSIWYGFYVNDLSSTQHTPYHQYKILESPIHSQFFMRSQFLIRSKSIPVKQDPLSLKGHNRVHPPQSVFIMNNNNNKLERGVFLLKSTIPIFKCSYSLSSVQDPAPHQNKQGTSANIGFIHTS